MSIFLSAYSSFFRILISVSSTLPSARMAVRASLRQSAIGGLHRGLNPKSGGRVSRPEGENWGKTNSARRRVIMVNIYQR